MTLSALAAARPSFSGLNISVRGEGYTAYLAIDSVYRNTSSGGVRIGADVTAVEAQTLAHEMSLKYAFFRLPRGGAKMVVAMPTDAPRDERFRMLRELGERLGPIIRMGVYHPGMDMNCGEEELQALYAGAGIAIGKSQTDSAFYTAVGVANALEACYDELAPGRPLTLAIAGFGRVAGHLAERLLPERFRIVAISTVRGGLRRSGGFDGRELAAARSRLGDDVVRQLAGEQVDREELLEESVDVFLPAARVGAITTAVARNVQARVVLPIANAPYAEADTISELVRRGVLCFPGYVINGGGVFGSSLYDSGLPASEVESLSETYYRPIVGRLISRSRELSLPPTRVAEAVSLRELDQRRQAPPESRADKIKRRLERRLPAIIRRRLARDRFAQRMQDTLSTLDKTSG